MSGSLQKKLLDHEVAPPPYLWDKIQAQLDEDFHSADVTISEKLEETHITPPLTAWDKIAASLDETGNERIKPGKVVRLLIARIAVAVILAAVVGVTVMYLLTGNGDPASFTGRSGRKTAVRYKPSVAEEKQPVPSPAAVLARRAQAHLLPALNRYTVSAAALQEAPGQNDEEAITDFTYLPNAETDLQTVPPTGNVSVPALPIRDRSGNIIMDMAIITNGDSPYITVTSPNGTQTKISRKFLPCLSYLNNDSQGGGEGVECSEQFREWRNKLLSQAAYVPSANNFFDIFELQQMIQD